MTGSGSEETQRPGWWMKSKVYYSASLCQSLVLERDGGSGTFNRGPMTPPVAVSDFI